MCAGRPSLLRASLIAALSTLSSPTLAHSHVDWWTASIAVAGVARVRGSAEADVAFDLRGEGLFGDPSRVRLGGFAELRVTGSAELSGAVGLSLAAHLTGRDGGTSLVFSLGGALHDRGGLDAAGLARLWWGLRAPIESARRYELALGLWAEARYFPRDSTVDALAGLSVDFYGLALPFIYLGAMLAPARR